MFLFIFESIGTSELLLIGIIALIFLGPRKLPEIARKIGKTMAEFRSTTQEFRSTWEREVDFEEEAKAFEIEDQGAPETKGELGPPDVVENSIGTPQVKMLDRESFDRIVADSRTEETKGNEIEERLDEVDVLSDKRTWL